MKAKASWLKRARAAVPALLSIVVAVLAFFLWRRRQQDQVATLKDAVAVAHAEQKIAVLEAQRHEVSKRIEGRTQHILAVEAEIDANKRKIVEARTGASRLTREQVLAEYRRLGYTK